MTKGPAHHSLFLLPPSREQEVDAASRVAKQREADIGGGERPGPDPIGGGGSCEAPCLEISGGNGASPVRDPRSHAEREGSHGTYIA
jgi:hypothetical protein